MTKLIDLEKRYVTVQSESGPLRKNAYVSGQIGIIESMAPTVDHPISYRIVHIPSGAMLRFQIYHDETKACAALAALNRMRNTWDFINNPTAREQERMSRRFHEIAEENGMCVDCVEYSINKNRAIRKDGRQLKFGGANGYDEPETDAVEESK